MQCRYTKRSIRSTVLIPFHCSSRLGYSTILVSLYHPNPSTQISMATPSPPPPPPAPCTLRARLRQALVHAGQSPTDAREEGQLALLFDHIHNQGNACGLAWLLDPLPAARAVCTHTLLNDMLDVAATEVAGAPCVRVLLARGADPIGQRRTPTLMAVLNRLRFVLGSSGCGAGTRASEEEKAQRLLAVAEAMIGAMTPAQLNARVRL